GQRGSTRDHRGARNVARRRSHRWHRRPERRRRGVPGGPAADDRRGAVRLVDGQLRGLALPRRVPRLARQNRRAAPRRRLAAWLGLLGVALACHRAAPASRFPTPRDAIESMRESVACSRGLTGEGTFDYFGDEGRVRAKSLYV